MNSAEWFATNEAGMHERLAFLAGLPDGAIHERPESMHRLVVWKAGTFLELHFLGSKDKQASREVISDLDFAKPLYLVAGFTQAMMLSLLWKPQPQRVYVLGFGAGRVPMLLHHHFPEVRVESTDIDPDVVQVVRKYFGVVTDERLKVIVQDGRQYLARRGADERYDIIVIDAFRGVGFSPVALGTLEFNTLCRNHLTGGGVLVVNLLRSDFLFRNKLRTLVDSFRHAWYVPILKDGSIIVFGTDADDPGLDSFVARATALQAEHQFASPFVSHAQNLQRVTANPEFAAWLAGATPLKDNMPAPPRPLPSHAPTRVGRNDPCPCGSGLKYKKCHGQPPRHVP